MTAVLESTTPPPPEETPAAALKVEDLELSYVVRGIPRPVLRGVSFEIRPGEAYGLVGESGCGKSTTAYAAVRYLPRNARITKGRILVAGGDITRMTDEEVRQFRTRHASMVYQDPGSALNPSMKIGPQVIEAFTILGQDSKTARESASQVRTVAEKQAAQLVEAARAEAAAIVAAARKAAEEEAALAAQRAREQLRDQVATLAVAGAERILRSEIDQNRHAELLANLKKELR